MAFWAVRCAWRQIERNEGRKIERKKSKTKERDKLRAAGCFNLKPYLLLRHSMLQLVQRIGQLYVWIRLLQHRAEHLTQRMWPLRQRKSSEGDWLFLQKVLQWFPPLKHSQFTLQRWLISIQVRVCLICLTKKKKKEKEKEGADSKGILPCFCHITPLSAFVWQSIVCTLLWWMPYLIRTISL